METARVKTKSYEHNMQNWNGMKGWKRISEMKGAGVEFFDPQFKTEREREHMGGAVRRIALCTLRDNWLYIRGSPPRKLRDCLMPVAWIRACIARDEPQKQTAFMYRVYTYVYIRRRVRFCVYIRITQTATFSSHNEKRCREEKKAMWKEWRGSVIYTR